MTTTPSTGWRDRLTPRERDVLPLVAQGLTNSEIAAALGLRYVTVKKHVASICAKSGAKNRTRLLVAVAKDGAA